MIIAVIIMKFLISVKNSADAERAARNAVKLAKKADGSIIMIHVITPGQVRSFKRRARLWQIADGSQMFRGASVIDADDAKHRLQNRALAMLDGVLSRLHTDVAIETQVMIGKTPAGIMEAAEKYHADVIIMGPRGRFKVKRLLSRNGIAIW